MSEYLIPIAIKIALALLIFYLGRIIVKWLCRLVEKSMNKHGLDDMLIQLAKKTVFIALMGVVILASLSQIGVDTTSALAIFGAAGLAVGLALQDSLANFAAGVLIALFGPFKIGHYVETAGSAGTIREVGIFNTSMMTPDNKLIIIPNRLIYNDIIVNYSAESERRINLVFGIGYDDDIDKVRSLIEEIIAADDRILEKPATTIAVDELADSSVNFVVWPWVKNADFWNVRFSIIEQVKKSFDKNGISIPYPQQDIHIHQEK